ncbi:ABC transporter substrate-binding protein [Thioclava nitratireducens]|uniref:ABC transporter substrate-binding protein n=1 Tax=Thioclava nitratireducens TaxID=1915078 RepID=UPI002480414C|nr:ABC transporter substrate-binding protein [Thioclava nitratireducens]WGT48637.1 ABC transporter substrate-binding protein [Thioclava nitratireducens]
MKLTGLKSTIACIALVAATGAAWADKADDTLHVAFTKELENVDSYFNSSREGVVLQRAVWDGLIYRDPVTNEYKGNLATAWEWIDDTTIEFKLRKGVKFHDGSDFNADDVVYTIDFVADEANGVKTQRNVNWLKSAEKVDDYTVRIKLKEKFPAAIEFLSGPVSIYPSDYYAEVGPEGMGLKPVGTGPYKVVDVTPGQHFVLEKYEGYHDSPKGQPTVTNVDIRTIPDVNTQMAELFNGSLDLIWQVPSDQAEKLGEMDQFTVSNESTMRVGYLAMDASGRSGDTPFTDVRVRRAVNYAINRQELVDALLKGRSQVISTPCFPSQFGCDTEAAVSYEYDPERAKELLAEAGYPNGFTTDFYAYRDRAYAEAIASYLNAVGIDTNFKMLQYSALRELNMKGETPISFQTWGSYSVNDASAMISQFFKHGSLDDARDDKTLEYLNVADSATDPDVRKENYSKAIERITDQAYWAPMFSYNTNYVMTDEVSYTPTADEVLRFTTITWK